MQGDAASGRSSAIAVIRFTPFERQLFSFERTLGVHKPSLASTLGLTNDSVDEANVLLQLSCHLKHSVTDLLDCMHIGILEDDLAQQELYKLWFSSAQHACSCFVSVNDFIEALKKDRFDLLLIDWVLPESSGEEALRWVRSNLGWELPVIFITSRDSEVDVVTALRAGADDYVVKPPKYLELLARIESLSRRTKAQPVIQLGQYEINQDLRSIALQGKTAELTQKEYELACYMFQNPGKLLSRVHLLEKLWGLNANVDTRTVDTHVSRIRRKLGIGPEHGWQIIPVYGYGYRIERVDATAA